MIDEYKSLQTKPDSQTLLQEILSKEEDDPDAVNYIFQDYFCQIVQLDQTQMYSDEIPIYKDLITILTQFKELDFTNLYEMDLFTIFYNFVNFFIEDNYYKASKLISTVIKQMFIHLRSPFAENFSSTPLCRLFVSNLNMPIFTLFSVIVGDSEKVNRDLTNFGLLDCINDEEDNLDFRKTKFLFYSNYVNTCDLSDDFTDCKIVVDKCVNHVFEEDDDECYELRIRGICRSMERSKEMTDILVQHDIIGYVNVTLTTEPKYQRIFQCLRVLEILTFNPTDACKEQLMEKLSLNELLQKLTISDETFGVKIGKMVWNCVINLLSYDDHIFDLKKYVDCMLPQLIIDTLENNGSFKMKQASLICLSNFLLSFNIPISSVFNDDMLNVVVLSFFDFSFISFQNDQDIFLCICKIIKSLIDENKFVYFEKIDEYLKRVEEETEFDQIINDKCGNLLTLMEQKMKEAE